MTAESTNPQKSGVNQIRGSDFVFEANPPDKERWIFISQDNFDYDEPDGFIKLLNLYRDTLQGKITKVSDDMQYKVDNDELGLIFQWDSCFGITVIVPESTDLDKAYDTLKRLCETI